MGDGTLNKISRLEPNVRLFKTYLMHLYKSGLIFRNVLQQACKTYGPQATCGPQGLTVWPVTSTGLRGRLARRVPTYGGHYNTPTPRVTPPRGACLLHCHVDRTPRPRSPLPAAEGREAGSVLGPDSHCATCLPSQICLCSAFECSGLPRPCAQSSAEALLPGACCKRDPGTGR